MSNKVLTGLLIVAGVIIFFLAIDNVEKEEKLAALRREIERNKGVGKAVAEDAAGLRRRTRR